MQARAGKERYLQAVLEPSCCPLWLSSRSQTSDEKAGPLECAEECHRDKVPLRVDPLLWPLGNHFSRVICQNVFDYQWLNCDFLPLALKMKKCIILHNQKSRGRTGSQNSEISHSVMSPRSQVLSTLCPAFLGVGFIPRLAPFLVTRWLPEASELPVSSSTFGRISILFSLSRPVVSILLYVKITRSTFGIIYVLIVFHFYFVYSFICYCVF